MIRLCAIGLLMSVVLGDERHLQGISHVGSIVDPNNKIDTVDNGLDNTDIVMSFVVFRHGDRTPDQEEIDKYPAGDENSEKIFFPHGKKALTNEGKQRGFRVGEYLRNRYNGLISTLYLPDEISVRTTDFARTKMTALTALAAMYPPTAAQKWNPFLNWQPIPYITTAAEDDDLLYYNNCQHYINLRDRTYNLPEIERLLRPYDILFKLLSKKTNSNITTAEDVFYLDNLFQAMENVGVQPPLWAQQLMPKIKEVTKIEFLCEFYNSELIRLSSGVLLADIVKVTSAAIEGKKEQPKLYLFSAHENNVAGFMAAIKVFKPHQPHYGATISLELRKNRLTGKYGFTAVYAADAGGPGVVLPIGGCGGQAFCDYDRFISLTQENVLSRREFKKQCSL